MSGPPGDQKIPVFSPSTPVSESPTTAASGEPGGLSFAEVFRDHAPFLWRATVALGVPERDADDLCQEVMLVVHRKLGDFRGGSLRSWLYSICLRVTSDYRRSARVRAGEARRHSLPARGRSGH